jgi:hypothetical protein
MLWGTKGCSGGSRRGRGKGEGGVQFVHKQTPENFKDFPNPGFINFEVSEFILRKFVKEGREEVSHLTEEGVLNQGERRGLFNVSQRGIWLGDFGGRTIIF